MFNVDSSLKKYGLTHLFKFWVKKTKFRKKPGHEKPFLGPRDEPCGQYGNTGCGVFKRGI